MDSQFDLNCVGREKFVDGVKHMEETLKGEQFTDLHVLDMFCGLSDQF